MTARLVLGLLIAATTAPGHLRFDFKADAAVQAENNQEVTEAVFNQRLIELARDIDRRFGERHPTAKRPRLESVPARTSLSQDSLPGPSGN
jgi:hypothetical protein